MSTVPTIDDLEVPLYQTTWFKKWALYLPQTTLRSFVSWLPGLINKHCTYHRRPWGSSVSWLPGLINEHCTYHRRPWGPSVSWLSSLINEHCTCHRRPWSPSPSGSGRPVPAGGWGWTPPPQPPAWKTEYSVQRSSQKSSSTKLLFVYRHHSQSNTF